MTVIPKHRRGFSLLELMVVVAVITVMMTYALPNVLGGRQTEQLKSATDDVIDIFHYAKVRSANAFVAYGVQFVDQEGGRLEVIEGSRPDCASVDFNDTPVKWVHFQAPTNIGGEWNVANGKMIEIVDIVPNINQLCFTPDGRFVRASDSKPVPATLQATNYQAGEYMVSLARVADGTILGLQHHVIVSYSGRARFTFGDTYADAEGEGY